MRRSPHDPTRAQTYFRVHENRMERFLAAGFVRHHTLRYEQPPGEIRIFGEIACLGNIVIRVDKTLMILDGEGLDALVQTVEYAYNATVGGHGNILRYDNAHPHPGHPDPHHRHDFNWRTGEELPGSPSWRGVLGWPTLGAFIEEVGLVLGIPRGAASAGPSGRAWEATELTALARDHERQRKS